MIIPLALVNAASSLSLLQPKHGLAETSLKVNPNALDCSNYRTWIFMACYGFSFGVELTVDNNLAPYIQTQFSKSLVASGNFAAIFGLLNFFSRPGGELIGCTQSFLYPAESSEQQLRELQLRARSCQLRCAVFLHSRPILLVPLLSGC